MKSVWYLIRESVLEWNRDNASRLSAALAYYTIFSLAPLLIIFVALTGLALGPVAVRGEFVTQFGNLVGPQAAQQLQTMVEHAYQPRAGAIASALGLATLVLGALGVFTALKDALNTIWDAPPRHGHGVWELIRDRVLSIAMILGIAFLLLVSLVVSAALSALGKWAAGILSVSATILVGVNFVVSLAVISVLFAMIYKILPDLKIDWKDVWIGSAITALLFTIGKELIGLYLGRSSISSVYGAAGSFAILLVWIYYSASILLLGAEFTNVYSRRWGSLARRRAGFRPQVEIEEEHNRAQAGKG